MTLDKFLTIKHDKENTTKEDQEWIQIVEDFFNKNFKKMYEQMLLYGEWLIVRLEDGSLELV